MNHRHMPSVAAWIALATAATVLAACAPAPVVPAAPAGVVSPYRLAALPDQARALLVIASHDFYWREYAETRQGLLERGVAVEVAAGSTAPCVPHAWSGQAGDGIVTPDVAIADADPARYDAIVFVGGWGAASYQFATPYTYQAAAYNGDPATRAAVNDLIGAFADHGKVIGGLCHGVSALAWSRRHGTSLLAGRNVTGWNGPAPDAVGAGAPSTRSQVEANGGRMAASGAIGDPSTAADDVVIDGHLVTGENYDSSLAFGRAVATTVHATQAPAAVKPVLLVLPNQDFYYQDYADPRAALEAAGVPVRVAAGAATTCTPHAWSGQGPDGGLVEPDLALADVDPAAYAGLVFVGGWGAAAYQAATPHAYAAPAYNGDPAVRARVNELVGAFSAQGKYVTGICYGVSALALARVDGASPLAGRTAIGWLGDAPWTTTGEPSTTAWALAYSGATLADPASLGDPATAADNVIVDGRIITAQDYQAATRFGEILADRVRFDRP